MQKKIAMPEDGKWILERLQKNGYAAYAVGGCVRDALLDRTPHDWDFCTAATPEQMLSCFSDVPCLTIGQAHGTIGVLRNGIIYEVTTFRQESTYQDHRHPDAVTFTSSLQADLQRRDFTINAMAYHPEIGVVDWFGGAKDLQQNVLRCVGNPSERFQEDALRILRGIRFAARYGFSIASETAEAMQDHAALLQYVSVERIQSECSQIVTAPFAAEILWQHGTVLFSVLPEWKPLDGFLQYHPRHIYDVWQHSLSVLKHCDHTDEVLCWAALLHDIGKPACFQMDENGVGHFHGHPQKSAELAAQITNRLKMEKKKAAAIVELVQQHELPVPVKRKQMLRLLRRMGEVQVKRLLRLRKADIMAQNPVYAEADLQHFPDMELMLEQILQEAACFSLRQLSINGQDLLALGIPEGKMVGNLLHAALDQVLEGNLPNEKQSLLDWIAQQQ